ncbi:hypothetical protein N9L19_00200 [bacterium]|nr:hypothetical protein [bacterium]
MVQHKCGPSEGREKREESSDNIESRVNMRVDYLQPAGKGSRFRVAARR